MKLYDNMFLKNKVFIPFILIFSSIAATLITLELVAMILIKFDVQLIKSQEVEVHPNQKRARKIEKLLTKLDYSQLEWPTYSDDEKKLKHEAPVHKKGKKGTYLFSEKRNRLTPNVNEEFELRSAKTNRLKWVVKYSTDKLGRRITINSSHENDYNVVFLGCSFTFGQGVENKETFPSRFSKLTKNTRVLNLGISGGSPAVTLEQINDHGKELLSDLDDKPTIYIFTFIDDHLFRVLGTSSYLNRGRFTEKKPVYKIENGKLVFHKTFKDYYGDLLEPYKKLSQFNLSKILNLDFPPITTKSKLVIVQIFKELQKKLQKITKGQSHFHISYFIKNHRNYDLFELLKENNINTLNYAFVDSNEILKGNETLKYGDHPSKYSYDLYAKLLAFEISEKYPEITLNKNLFLHSKLNQ